MSKPNCQWKGCSKTPLNLQFLLSRKHAPRFEGLYFCSEACFKAHVESELHVRWQRIEHDKRQRVPRPKLGTILLQTSTLTPHQLEEALRVQRHSKQERLGECLVRLGLVEERQITQAVARQFGLPIMDLGNSGARIEIARLIPGEVARLARCVPVGLDDQDSVLRLAIAGPVNFHFHEAIRRMVNKRVLVFIANQSAIESLLQRLYPLPLPEGQPEAVCDSFGSMREGVLGFIGSAINQRAGDMRLELLSGLLWARVEFSDRCQDFVCRCVLPPTRESAVHAESPDPEVAEAVR